MSYSVCYTVHTAVDLTGTTTRRARSAIRWTFTKPPPLTLTTRTPSTPLPELVTFATTPPPQYPCFPSTARVQIPNGKSVTMSELQIGDHVLVGKELFCFYKKNLKDLSRFCGAI